MSYVYELNDEQVTLEELVELHKDLWDKCLWNAYKLWSAYAYELWGVCYLFDIIAKASEEFESELIEENISVNYITHDGGKFDLNLLLSGITYSEKHLENLKDWSEYEIG